jgi:hypothetical protein
MNTKISIHDKRTVQKVTGKATSLWLQEKNGMATALQKHYDSTGNHATSLSGTVLRGRET